MGAPAPGDGSAVIAILVYKAVNKAAPSKGVARVATLVIRRPSATPLQGRRHRGAHSMQRSPLVVRVAAEDFRMGPVRRSPRVRRVAA